jgi:hypothetical protein
VSATRAEEIIGELLFAQVKAIRLCINERLITPALMLIYCGMDAAASMSRPAKQEEVQREDFVAWAERYMHCKERLDVRGIDLYGARCGILHAYTAESRQSRNETAVRLFYAWGDKTAEEGNQLFRSLGKPEKMVKIEDLFETFADGLSNFVQHMDSDPDMAGLALSRTNSMLASVRSILPTEELG